MFVLFVGNIDENIPNMFDEVVGDLCGFTRKEIKNEKKLKVWMNGLGKHKIGSTEHLCYL